MKKLLPYAGFAAAFLGLISFILILACSSVIVSNGGTSLSYSGAIGIFGGTLGYATYSANGGAIFAFILLILGILCLVAYSLLPMLKLKLDERIPLFIGWGGALLLIVAAILIFCEVPMFLGVNGISDIREYCHLGAGWVIAGIIAILGAGVACVPTVLRLIKK